MKTEREIQLEELNVSMWEDQEAILDDFCIALKLLERAEQELPEDSDIRNEIHSYLGEEDIE